MVDSLKQYAKRLGELIVVVGGGAFVAALVQSGGKLDRASVAAGLGAAVAAVYGVLVKPAGDITRPGIVK